MQVQSSFLALTIFAAACFGSSILAFPETVVEQRSKGACSPPIVNNEGHVSISCPGIAPEALHYLENHLSEQFGQLSEQLRELNDSQRTISNLNDLIEDLHKQADGWAQRYYELSVRLGDNRDDSEQSKQAHELIQKGEFARAEAILEGLATNQEGDVSRAAATQFNLGDLAILRYDVSAALPRYERAYRLESNNYTYALRYGIAALNNRDYADAENALQQALKATNGFPDKISPRVNQALVFDNLSSVYLNTARLSLASEMISKVKLICSSLSNTDPDYSPCLEILIDVGVQMGLKYYQAGQVKESEDTLLNTRDVARGFAMTFPGAKVSLVVVLNDLVAVYTIDNQYSEAESAAKEALDLAADFPIQIRDGVVSAIQINLGYIYLVTKQYDQAERFFLLALETRRQLALQAPGAYRPDVALILMDLSRVYNQTKRSTDAAKAVTEAVDIYRQEMKHTPSVGIAFIYALIEMAEMESQSGQILDAEKLLQEAKDTLDTLPSPDLNSRAALSRRLDEQIAILQKAAGHPP